MSLRISGGYLKGRKLESPKDGPGVRPTTERVKLAIFSVIGTGGVEGKKCLDLFACTGALGIEALSRDAKSCDFVEKSYRNYKLINRNLRGLEISNKSRVFCKDSKGFLGQSEGGYGLVLLDPPFAMSDWDKLMGLIAAPNIVDEEGITVAEHPAGIVLKNEYGPLKRFSKKRYGDSEVSFYGGHHG